MLRIQFINKRHEDLYIEDYKTLSEEIEKWLDEEIYHFQVMGFEELNIHTENNKSQPLT